MKINDTQAHAVHAALDAFQIELPSWGFANTGTRFGKFAQDAAAATTEEKFHDAGLVNRLTGCCPTVAVHVLWDFDVNQPAEQAAKATVEIAEKNGVRVGSINPNVFQSQAYKLGSFCSPLAEARQKAMDHAMYCVDVMAGTGSRVLSWWMADGTNYPGQDNLRERKKRLEQAFAQVAERMRDRTDDGLMLIEYKPFEPAFYHTDIADWGMAASFARKAGEGCKVLVDTGHHLPGANIEHLVAFMLDEDLLGGFHFNDRKYADDDLTLGSIDPYQVFRIFNEIAQYEHDTGEVGRHRVHGRPVAQPQTEAGGDGADGLRGAKTHGEGPPRRPRRAGEVPGRGRHCGGGRLPESGVRGGRDGRAVGVAAGQEPRRRPAGGAAVERRHCRTRQAARRRTRPCRRGVVCVI